MTEVVAYALFCGFALSAFLVPVTALAMRHDTELSGATRHMIWFMVLVATVAATAASVVVSAVRPVQQFSGAVIASSAPAPAALHGAAVPLAAIGLASLVCWLVVSIVKMLRIARRVATLRTMKRRALPIAVDCELPRGARALASDTGAPSAVGFLHPAILLPPDTMQTLDPADARRVVLHEIAHLRRGDDLTGLVFLLCAATLWFNPFVHYIGKRLSIECEIACDERVIAQTGDAARYAKLLFEMAEHMTERGPQLAWNGFAHQSGFVVRMQNLLLDRRAPRRALPRPALAVLVGGLLSGVALAAFNAPALARAEDGASTRVYQMVRSEPPSQVRQAPQHVRPYPVCKVYRSPATRKSPDVCEAPAMQFTPATMKVIPAAMNVNDATVKFTESNVHVTAARLGFTPATTRIKKKGATP